jgi:hypothetical protein
MINMGNKMNYYVTGSSVIGVIISSNSINKQFVDMFEFDQYIIEQITQYETFLYITMLSENDEIGPWNCVISGKSFVGATLWGKGNECTVFKSIKFEPISREYIDDFLKKCDLNPVNYPLQIISKLRGGT